MVSMSQDPDGGRILPTDGLPLPGIAGWPTGVWIIAGGLSIAFGVYGDVGALMIAAFVIPAVKS
jgi:hypothetical protein